MSNKSLEGADKQWGFHFGVDGTLSIDDAADFLSVSDRTVYRLEADGLIRTGRVRGKKVVCKRSLMVYLRTCEV